MTTTTRLWFATRQPATPRGLDVMLALRCEFAEDRSEVKA